MSDIFRAAAPAVAFIFLSCAGSARREVPSAEIRQGEILNLRLVNSIGPGLGDGLSLVDPAAVTVSGAGDIYISDRATNMIYMLSSELALLSREGGISGSGGGFNRPEGLACDAALNLYIADYGNRRIQILDRNLHFVRSIDSYFDENEEAASFNAPVDLAFDGEGNLWVADDTRALKIDPFQKLILEISEKAPAFFIIGRISSIDISHGRQLAISDIGNHKIFLCSIYGSYAGKFDVASPSAMAWNGNELWICDSRNGKLAAFDTEGYLLYAFSGDEPAFRPAWIAVDSAGKLVVIDSGSRKIKVFEVIRQSNAAGGG